MYFALKYEEKIIQGEKEKRGFGKIMSIELSGITSKESEREIESELKKESECDELRAGGKKESVLTKL